MNSVHLSAAALAVFAVTACASASSGATQSEPTPRVVGAFTLTAHPDPLTKQAHPQISTFDEKHNGMLSFWCVEHGLSALIGLSGEAVTGSPASVTVRYATDSMSAPSAPTEWLVQRQSGFPLAYLHPQQTAGFRDTVLRAPEIRFAVKNARNNSITNYTFSLAGARDAFASLTCPLPKWP